MSSAAPSSPHDDVILVEAADLPVYCPGPKAPLWSMHPRVYIELAKAGKASCPYCSATYQLKEGEQAHGH
ncbi:zinc-finger domain-containing protein [Eoetvoesiella caeni]|uniref:Putative Zn-finger protein n=1 Tax=Eoetvoesiella caeni TaxID=645616 RepID=A0A366HAK6_9BURK|nr:zinc-finger domain-containing protein [Eoetvoesiella caeni]MCI2809312.1 zinc-finger domain-containing protein [Eoetvoesiella caeni]NYT54452.1 zinc-finger domain-containing protein [Eoetvoesiella caeni]RBP39360.1 putative Zn-finger protein [Eoetvoesiella caeni]